MTPLPIVLESCSKPQKTWHAFEAAVKKNFWFVFFVSDIISGVVLDLINPLRLALGPNC